MSKITYLLGAGASCNALPLVNNFKDRLDSFHTRLVDKLRPHIQPSNEKETRELFPFGGKKGKDLQESIVWLKDIADKHASIDTYAKKLFIKNDNEALKELKKLKATLSCFFLLEQSLMPADKRYDNFFASILFNNSNSIPSLPDGINIMTWNYDTQLEKSYQGFCTDPSFVYKGLTQNKNIIRLNGTCALPEKDNMSILGYCDFNIPFLEEVIKLFKNFTTTAGAAVGYQPNISFAWENKLGGEVINTIAGTTSLIIIGYSLPYFNREIDKALISNMSPNLRIFIQAPKEDYESLKERFLAIFTNPQRRQSMENKIEPIYGTDLFYIPDDMPR